MYAPSFAYHRASSLADAAAAARRQPRREAPGRRAQPAAADEAAPGRPSALVDIGRVAELKGISAADGGVRIGALTTHAAIAASDVVRGSCAVLAEAAGQIGDPAVRNRGTIGGSVAHADPAADLPTVLVALGAKVDVAGAKGARTVAAKDFFVGMMATALATARCSPRFGCPRSGRGAAPPTPSSRTRPRATPSSASLPS